jgi:adenylate cyclase
MDTETAKQREQLLAGILPEPSLTGPQAAAAAEISHDDAQRIWRALGMPHVEEHVVAFSQLDVESLRTVTQIMDTGFPLEAVISVARVLGQSMSRVTDAQTRMVHDHLVGPLLAEAEQTVDDDQFAPLVRMLMESSEPLLNHVYRLHLSVAIQRMSLQQEAGSSESLAVGFVDLVGFSRLSDDLQQGDLGDLISRFEDLVIQVCTDSGVRLVKIVGDAVMFVSSDPLDCLKAAWAIVDRLHEDGSMPEARAGLDMGPVLPMSGDYFGRPVNVASRITAFARNGTVVCSGAFLDSLPDGIEGSESELEVTKVGPRRLKDVGRVSLFKVRIPHLH